MRAETCGCRAGTRSVILAMLVGVLLGVVPSLALAANVIVNHSNYSLYDSADASTISSLGQIKVFFSHASVGGNIMQGMESLNSANGSRYVLDRSSDDDTPPATTVAGTVYDYNRSNPGWSAKISQFETYISNGWSKSKVDVAINKMCYVDEDCDWATYRDSMSSLESSYPNVKFVYCTIPIKTATGSSDGWKRQQFNANLRTWIASQDNKYLLDVADIEAYSASGQEQTSTYQGNTYQLLYSGYTTDGGHLNTTGGERVAKGMYTLLSYAAGETSFYTDVPATTNMGMLGLGLLLTMAGMLVVRRQQR